MTVKHNNSAGVQTDWTTPGTWDPFGVPTAADQVFIDAGNSQVVLSNVGLVADGFASQVTIANTNLLTLLNGHLFAPVTVQSGGRLQADDIENRINSIFNTGEVQVSADVGNPGSLHVTEYNSTNVGELDIENNGQFVLDGPVMRNGGSIHLNSIDNTGRFSKLLFESATTELRTFFGITDPNYQYQGGTIELTDSRANQITAAGSSALLDNFNNTIRGSGQFGAGKLSIVNRAAQGDGTHSNDHSQGVISATGTQWALQIELGTGTTLKNGGLIEGTGKAGLEIFTTPPGTTHANVWNTGTIQANANSKVSLTSIDVNNTGGTIRTAAANAQLNLTDARITGGTVQVVAGSQLVVDQQATLNGTAFNLAGGLVVGPTGTLNFKGGTLDFAGNVTAAGKLLYDGDLTLHGGAQVVVDGSLSNPDGKLTNHDANLSGSGQINVRDLVNEAGGHISGPLALNASQLLDNKGAITGVKIKTTNLDNGGTITNTDLTRAQIINNFGGTIVNSSFGETTSIQHGTIKADGGQVTFNASGFGDGNLASLNGGVINVLANSNGTALSQVAIASGTTFQVADGASLEFLNGNFTSETITLDNVTISLNGKSAPTTLNYFARTASSLTLTGGSKIVLSDSTANRVLLERAATLTNVNGLISGGGTIVEGTDANAHGTLINQAGGTIEANAKNNGLKIALEHITNDGTFEADGARLEVDSPNAIAGGGTMLVTNGGILDLSGVSQFAGGLRYIGKGTIEGPQTAPAGTITGFSTGATYLFGQTTSFTDPLTVSWLQGAGGGTLTIKSSPSQTFANLQLSGTYEASDFSAVQVQQADGKHVAVNFVGAIRWVNPVNGSFQTASNWTGAGVPGIDDNALITVAGGPYTVTSTADTTVKSIATGSDATLDIKSGKFTTMLGTATGPNAGTIKVEAGGSFVVGGTFQQAATGKIATKEGGASVSRLKAGPAARIDMAKGATISGGQVILDAGTLLNVTGGGTATLADGAVKGDGSVNVAGNSVLTLVNSMVTADIALTGGGDLAISGNNVVLGGNVTMAQGTQITGAAVPGTVTNNELISGTGKIGGSNLTLVNKDRILTGTDAAPAGIIHIDTGAIAIDNRGTLSARANGLMELHSVLNNTKTVSSDGPGARVKFDGDVTNNSGELLAKNGGKLEMASGVTITGGQIGVDSGTSLNAAAGGLNGLTNVDIANEGTLFVDSHTQLTLTDGSVTGGGEIHVGGGSKLTLVDSTVGTDIELVDGSDLGVGGKSTVGGTLTMNKASEITGNGSPATLTNKGTINIAGNSKASDGNVTLVNQGTVSVLLHAALDFAGALNNANRVEANGGEARFKGAVANSSVFSAGLGAEIEFDAAVTNSGALVAEDGGTVDIHGAVTQTAGGRITGTDAFSSINMAGGSSVAGGQIGLSGGGRLFATGGGTVTLTNTDLDIDSFGNVIVGRSTHFNLVNSTIGSTGKVQVTDNSTLGLADSTLLGGTYSFTDGAAIAVGGKSFVTAGTLALRTGTKITSNGAAAALTNDGDIVSNGGTIGDATLTLVNKGKIETDDGAKSLVINTGANAVANDGIITASGKGSTVTLASALKNGAAGSLLSGDGTVTAASVDSDGYLEADGTGHIAILGNLKNSGRVVATGGGTLDAQSTNNSGKEIAQGPDSKMTLGDGTHANINSGLMSATDRATLELNGGVDNGTNGRLVVNTGAEIQVLGASIGGVARIIGKNSTLDLEGSATENTTTKTVFAPGTNGDLLINHSDHFAGTVAGFDRGDSIDVKDIAFVAGKSSYDVATKVLHVSDGTHTANIQLMGNYAATNFKFAGDGLGGTLVTTNFVESGGGLGAPAFTLASPV